MYKTIFNDYIVGLIHSLRIDLVATALYKNNKIRNLAKKICLFNLVLFFVPTLFAFIVRIVSTTFHLLYFMDLVNALSDQMARRKKRTIGIIELLSLAVTMTLYQFFVYLVTLIISFVLYPSFYWFGLCLNFFILTIYHSFYCFNNLWQHYKIGMAHRVDIQEKMWPYYVGFGTVASMIYLYASFGMYPNIFSCVYNVYLFMILCLPFYLPNRFPKRGNVGYFSINLSIFSYMMGMAFRVVKYLRMNSE